MIAWISAAIVLLRVAEKPVYFVAGAVSSFALARLQARATRRDRRRAVASAILVEARRIHDAITPPNHLTTLDAPNIPTVHRWFEGTIVAAAEISPALVTDFIQLEDDLRELADTQARYIKVRGELLKHEVRAAKDPLATVDPKYLLDRESFSQVLYDAFTTSHLAAVETLKRIDDAARAALPKAQGGRSLVSAERLVALRQNVHG